MFPTPALLELFQSNLSRDLRAMMPELILIGSVVLMLASRLFDRFRHVHLLPFALGASLCALAVASTQWLGEPNFDPRQDGMVTSNAVPLFGGMLSFDSYAIFGRVFLLLFLCGGLTLSLLTGIPDREDSADFGTMLLGATLGMMLMCSANHLLMMFLAFEMASVPSYAMAGFLKGKRTGSEAALKYVVFGGASAGMMLYGISLVCAHFGSAALVDVAAGYASVIGAGNFDLALAAGTLFIMIGLAFKLSIVPFHFWCPDVFHGAAAEVGAFLSVASKGAAVLLTGRILLAFDLPDIAGIGLIVLSALTMTVGNLAALAQTNLKRLLAYSTIAHAGYLTMALATLRPDGIAAALFYLVAYLLMNLGAFAVVALIRNRTGSEEIDACRGLLARSPVLAITMTLFIMSLLGLPPLAGFAAKFQIFAAVYDAGQIAASTQQASLAYAYYGLLLVGALNTVISLGYYLRLIRSMMLEEPSDSVTYNATIGQRGFLGILASLLLVVGVLWNPLTTASERATASLTPAPHPEVVQR